MLYVAAAFISGAALVQCTSPNNKKSTVVSNARINGIVYTSDSTPARNAMVHFHESSMVADTAAGFSPPADSPTFITDVNGRYAIQTIDTGSYIIEATDSQNNLAQASFRVPDTGARITLPPCYLRPAGAIMGNVMLPAGGDPRKTFVLVPGNNRVAKADSLGRFTFIGLAEGTYGLELLSSIHNYAIFDTAGVHVLPGDTTRLGTIAMPMADIGLTLAATGTQNDTASNNDSVRIVATFYNSMASATTIAWLSSDRDSVYRQRTLAAGQWSDTLLRVWPTAGSRIIRVKATDSSGAVWNDSIAVTIIIDLPVAFAGKDTAVRMNALALLHGTATKRFGRIVKWEWNIGKAGFTATSSGDTTIITPDSVVNVYPCILRVTGDDGNIGLDTVNLQVGRWEVVGTGPISDGAAYNLSFAVWNDTPYVLYSDAAISYQATMMKFSGNQWSSVGSKGFTSPYVQSTAIAVYNNTPYAAYVAGNAAGVKSFNGSQWVSLGPDSIGYAALPRISLAVNNGIPTVVYQGIRIIAPYQYINNAWTQMGTQFFTRCVATSVIVAGNVPYYNYFSDTLYGDSLEVAQFSNNQWTSTGPIGVAPVNEQGGDNFSLAQWNGTPYLSYLDLSNEPWVMQYTGSGWSVVGTSGFYQSAVWSISLALWNNVPYVAFLDKTGYTNGSNGTCATVMRFNGSQWTPVGNICFTPETDNACIAISNGHIYVAYSDASNGNKAMLMRLM